MFHNHGGTMSSTTSSLVSRTAAPDSRTLTERADGLTEILANAAQRLGDIRVRLGADNAKGLPATVDVPRPPRLLPASLEESAELAREIMDSIEFIAARL